MPALSKTRLPTHTYLILQWNLQIPKTPKGIKMPEQKRVLCKLAALALSLPLVSSLNLNVTAIGARDGFATLECWQMDSPFETSSQPGTSGTAMAMLSSVSNLSYSIIPSGFDGGVHNAPYTQQVPPCYMYEKVVTVYKTTNIGWLN